MEYQTIPKNPRIRMYLDSLGMNKQIQVDIQQVNEKILDLKKLNSPIKPLFVKKSEYTKITQDRKRPFITTDHEKQYNENVAKYEKEYNTWNQYVSKEYMMTKSAHKCITLLEKLKIALGSSNEKVKSESLQITDTLQKTSPVDTIVKRFPKETLDEFSVRKAKLSWHPASFGIFIKEKNVGVANIDKITADIKTTYPQVELFLSKRSHMKDKERFSDDGISIIAQTAGNIMKELISSSISNARRDGSKKINPEHIISSNNTIFQHFYKQLPQYKIIEERERRRSKYENECIIFKNNEVKKRIEDFKLQKKEFNPNKDIPKFENIKDFKDKEVFDGFAVIHEKLNAKQQVRSIYKWNGIDYWKNEEETSFIIYSKKYFDEILKDCEIDFSNKSTSCGLKVSSATNIIINNIVIEFLKYLIPRFEHIKELCGNKKTTDGKMVLHVIKTILMQNEVSEMSEDQDYIYRELEKHLPISVKNKLQK